MGKTRRRFTREFKTSIIHELEAGKSMVELSREHAVHPSLLSKWKHEYNSSPETAFAGNGNACKLDAKIAKYERIIGQLYAENDFLKKALLSLGSRLSEERKSSTRVSST
jgi:transposase-like protein